MDVTLIMEIITTIGFPIACVIAMGFFIYKIYGDMKAEKQAAKEENAKNMAAVQARCQEREEKLYAEIALNREINGKAIETITLYAERLDAIQQDIKDIKTDITVIMAKE